MSNYIEKTYQCELCGNLYLNKSQTDCPACGHKHGHSTQVHINTNEAADPEMHKQYSWFCSYCESRGLAWIEKEKLILTCPNCGKPLGKYRAINTDIGTCVNIWDNDHTDSQKSAEFRNMRTSMNIKKITCHTCDRLIEYRFLPPPTCPRCGRRII